LPRIRGLTVAVGDWYARTLEITLWRNLRHLSRCVVVTKPGDPCVAVARSVSGVDVLTTDAFTRHGAVFNKGLAIEETWDRHGRDGWWWVLDADILLPDAVPVWDLHPQWLHGARRRVLGRPEDWRPGLDWSRLPVLQDGQPIGFSQLFHGDAEAIRGRRPWYCVNYPHAGGCDAYFLDLFPPNRRRMLPMDVLHLGPVDSHWFGVDDDARRMMAAMAKRHRMHRSNALGGEAADDFPRRVDVPGYTDPGYLMPMERRPILPE
jgi:hypothetical protein